MTKKYDEYTITANESQLIRIVKLICAVLVVFIHAMPEFEHPTGRLPVVVRFIWVDCVCSCAVPVFFVLSGVLLFRKPFLWKDNLRKKVHTLLIPYLLINTFWIVAILIAQSIPMTSGLFKNTRYLRVTSWSFSDWIQAYTIGLIKEPTSWYGPAMGWLWFLRDLFVLNLLAPCLKRIIDAFPKLWFCLLGVLWIVVGTLNGLYGPVCALLFFSVGYDLVKHDVHFEDFKRIDTKLLWCVWTASCAVGFICHGRNRFLYGVSSILCILTVSCLLIRITEWLLMKKYPKNWFTMLAKYSIAIYLFHERSLSIAVRIVEKIAGGGALA